MRLKKKNPINGKKFAKYKRCPRITRITTNWFYFFCPQITQISLIFFNSPKAPLFL
jgi:hypothetical protein